MKATPIAESPAPGLPPAPPSGMRYRFQVFEDFSGLDRTSIELIRTEMTSCDPTYELGTEYVVYARRDASGQLKPGTKCDRTRPVNNADSDLEYLRRPKLVRTVLAGTLRMRTGAVAGERVIARTPLTSYETKTNKEGLFQFLGLPPGKYTLHSASHPDLTGLSAEVKEGACAIANSAVE